MSCHDVLLRFYFDMFITNIIVQVLTKGRQLLTSDVSPDESKDIRLQMKVLNERYVVYAFLSLFAELFLFQMGKGSTVGHEQTDRIAQTGDETADGADDGVEDLDVRGRK